MTAPSDASPTPVAPATGEEHPILSSRVHGVAPLRLVWLTAGLVLTALIALSACSTLLPSRAQTEREAATVDSPRWQLQDTPGHEGEPLIRVRIVRGEPVVLISGSESIRVTPPRRPRIRVVGGGIDETMDAGTQILQGPITVTLGVEAWRIADGRGHTRRLPRSTGDVIDDALRITSVDGSMLEVDGARLPGTLWLHGRTTGTGGAQAGVIDVVEHLPIEMYLPGVIAKELYPNWGLETFKAQAIAARSYALHERQRRIAVGSHFDVESTTQDQVYGGATTNPTALRAVEQTYGTVLTWQGHLLRAYYSSTTGGRAASARDTWPITRGFEYNLMPPIQASPRDDIDSFSPLFTWTVERDIEELSTRIRTFAETRSMGLRTLQQVAKIEPVARNEFDRPQRYRITEQGGRWWELSAEDTRLAMNHAGTSGLAAPTRDQRINSGDFTTRREGNKLIFEGRGFGHGVGMSQFGAEGMARRGIPAEEILMHYYPGAQLTKWY
ncbi:MAG: SpoIID/LytB domain-containing protein [Phycisphaerales bacterium]